MTSSGVAWIGRVAARWDKGADVAPPTNPSRGTTRMRHSTKTGPCMRLHVAASQGVGCSPVVDMIDRQRLTSWQAPVHRHMQLCAGCDMPTACPGALLDARGTHDGTAG
eukprot:353082-Chlamydomonas_euryale.AAC.16